MTVQAQSEAGAGAVQAKGASTGVRAIISDIHANREALEAVLEDIEQQKIRDVTCLGDMCGYGPDPVPVLNLIRKHCSWSLCGNHDAALFMSHAVGFNEAAAKAVGWHRSLLLPQTFSLPRRVACWRWLENLPAHRREGRVLYVHASPRDPLIEYVLAEDFQDMGFGPSRKVVEMFAQFEWVAFVGHSHRPGVATYDYRWIKPLELKERMYVLPQDRKTLVNIGAVGQPRDHNPDACYVIFDGETVRFRRVPYDVEKTQRKIRAIPFLEERLAARLAKGA